MKRHQLREANMTRELMGLPRVSTPADLKDTPPPTRVPSPRSTQPAKRVSPDLTFAQAARTPPPAPARPVPARPTPAVKTAPAPQAPARSVPARSGPSDGKSTKVEYGLERDGSTLSVSPSVAPAPPPPGPPTGIGAEVEYDPARDGSTLSVPPVVAPPPPPAHKAPKVELAPLKADVHFKPVEGPVDLFDAVEDIVQKDPRLAGGRDIALMAHAIGKDVSNHVPLPMSNEMRDSVAAKVMVKVVEKWNDGKRIQPHHAAARMFDSADDTLDDIIEVALPERKAEELHIDPSYVPATQNSAQSFAMKGVSDRRKLRGRAKHETWQAFTARTGRGTHTITIRDRHETWKFTASEIRMHNNIFQAPSPYVMDKVPLDIQLDSLGQPDPSYWDFIHPTLGRLARAKITRSVFFFHWVKQMTREKPMTEWDDTVKNWTDVRDYYISMPIPEEDGRAKRGDGTRKEEFARVLRQIVNDLAPTKNIDVDMLARAPSMTAAALNMFFGMRILPQSVPNALQFICDVVKDWIEEVKYAVEKAMYDTKDFRVLSRKHFARNVNRSGAQQALAAVAAQPDAELADIERRNILFHIGDVARKAALKEARSGRLEGRHRETRRNVQEARESKAASRRESAFHDDEYDLFESEYRRLPHRQIYLGPFETRAAPDVSTGPNRRLYELLAQRRETFGQIWQRGMQFAGSMPSGRLDNAPTGYEIPWNQFVNLVVVVTSLREAFAQSRNYRAVADVFMRATPQEIRDLVRIHSMMAEGVDHVHDDDLHELSATTGRVFIPPDDHQTRMTHLTRLVDGDGMWDLPERQIIGRLLTSFVDSVKDLWDSLVGKVVAVKQWMGDTLQLMKARFINLCLVCWSFGCGEVQMIATHVVQMLALWCDHPALSRITTSLIDFISGSGNPVSSDDHEIVFGSTVYYVHKDDYDFVKSLRRDLAWEMRKTLDGGRNRDVDIEVDDISRDFGLADKATLAESALLSSIRNTVREKVPEQQVSFMNVLTNGGFFSMLLTCFGLGDEVTDDNLKNMTVLTKALAFFNVGFTATRNAATMLQAALSAICITMFDYDPFNPSRSLVVSTVKAAIEWLQTAQAPTDIPAAFDFELKYAACASLLSHPDMKSVPTHMMQNLVRLFMSDTISNAHGLALRLRSPGSTRVKPVVILFAGESKKGKTTAMENIVKHFYSAITGAEFTPANAFRMSGVQKYFDGYGPQSMITICDEWMTVKDDEVRRAQSDFLLRAISPGDYVLDMAACEAKNRTLFRSLLVALATNMSNPADQVFGLEDPNAVYNRIHLFIEPVDKQPWDRMRFRVAGNSVEKALTALGFDQNPSASNGAYEFAWFNARRVPDKDRLVWTVSSQELIALMLWHVHDHIATTEASIVSNTTALENAKAVSAALGEEMLKQVRDAYLINNPQNANELMAAMTNATPAERKEAITAPAMRQAGPSQPIVQLADTFNVTQPSVTERLKNLAKKHPFAAACLTILTATAFWAAFEYLGKDEEPAQQSAYEPFDVSRSRARRRVAKPTVKASPSAILPGQQMVGAQLTQTITADMPAVVEVQAVALNGFKATTYGVFIGSHEFICVSHLFDHVQPQDLKELRLTSNRRNWKGRPAMVHIDEECDIACVKLPISFPPNVAVKPKRWSDKPPESFKAAEMMFVYPDPAKGTSVVMKTHVGRVEEVYTQGVGGIRGGAKHLIYPLATQTGHCGSLCYVEYDGTWKIIAMHTAGDGKKEGYGVHLDREYIDDLLSIMKTDKTLLPPEPSELFPPVQIPDQQMSWNGWEVVGLLDKKDAQHIQRDSSHGATPYPDVVPVPVAYKWVNLYPFRAVDGTRIDPLDKATEKLVKQDKPPLTTIPFHDEILAHMLHLYPPVEDDYILTQDEAINGIPGRIPGLSMNTAVGLPASMCGASRKFPHHFTKTETRTETGAIITKYHPKPHIQKLIDELWNNAQAGKRSVNWRPITLKKEMRKIAKVDAGQVRAFMAGNVQETIVFRRLFGHMTEEMMKKCTEAPISVGVDPHTQWYQLFSMLTEKSEYGVDGDFANYDASVHIAVARMAREFILAWHKNEHAVPRGTVLWEIMYAVLLLEDKLIQTVGVHPSGDPLTSFWNSICLMIVMYSTYLTLCKKYLIDSPLTETRLATYGDDNIMTSSEVHFPWAEFPDVVRKLYGMELTPASKTGEFVAKRIIEASYLSRRFVRSSGLMLAPLSLERIMASVFFPSSNDRQVVQATLDSAMIELAQYDKTTFDSIRNAIARHMFTKTNGFNVLSWYEASNISRGNLYKTAYDRVDSVCPNGNEPDGNGSSSNRDIRVGGPTYRPTSAIWYYPDCSAGESSDDDVEAPVCIGSQQIGHTSDDGLLTAPRLLPTRQMKGTDMDVVKSPPIHPPTEMAEVPAITEPVFEQKEQLAVSGEPVIESSVAPPAVDIQWLKDEAVYPDFAKEYYLPARAFSWTASDGKGTIKVNINPIAEWLAQKNIQRLLTGRMVCKWDSVCVGITFVLPPTQFGSLMSVAWPDAMDSAMMVGDKATRLPCDIWDMTTNSRQCTKIPWKYHLPFVPLNADGTVSYDCSFVCSVFEPLTSNSPDITIQVNAQVCVKVEGFKLFMLTDPAMGGPTPLSLPMRQSGRPTVTHALDEYRLAWVHDDRIVEGAELEALHEANLKSPAAIFLILFTAVNVVTSVLGWAWLWSKLFARRGAAKYKPVAGQKDLFVRVEGDTSFPMFVRTADLKTATVVQEAPPAPKVVQHTPKKKSYFFDWWGTARSVLNSLEKLDKAIDAASDQDADSDSPPVTPDVKISISDYDDDEEDDAPEEVEDKTPVKVTSIPHQKRRVFRTYLTDTEWDFEGNADGDEVRSFFKNHSTSQVSSWRDKVTKNNIAAITYRFVLDGVNCDFVFIGAPAEGHHAAIIMLYNQVMARFRRDGVLNGPIDKFLNLYYPGDLPKQQMSGRGRHHRAAAARMIDDYLDYEPEAEEVMYNRRQEEPKAPPSASGSIGSTVLGEVSTAATAALGAFGSSLASSAVKGALSLIGFDKPRVDEIPEHVVPDFAPDLYHIGGMDHSAMLAPDQKAHIDATTPRFSQDVDEDSLRSIAQRPSCIFSGAFQATDKFPVPVRPQFNSSTSYRTYAQAIGDLHKYWRGSMNYIIRINTSVLTSGTCKICLYPGLVSVGTEPVWNNDTYTKIFDVRGPTLYKFCVPWMSHQMWLQCQNTPLSIDPQNNGFFTVEWINKPVGPDVSAATPAYICIMAAAGPDIDFSGINIPEQGTPTDIMNFPTPSQYPVIPTPEIIVTRKKTKGTDTIPTAKRQINIREEFAGNFEMFFEKGATVQEVGFTQPSRPDSIRQLIRVPTLRGAVYVKKWHNPAPDPAATNGWCPYKTARCDFNFAADRFYFCQPLNEGVIDNTYGEWTYEPLRAFVGFYPIASTPQNAATSNFAFDYFKGWYQNYIGGARLKLVAVRNTDSLDIIGKRVIGPSSTPLTAATRFSGEGTVVTNAYLRGVTELEAPYERQDLFAKWYDGAPAQVDYTWTKVREKSSFLPPSATDQWEVAGVTLVYTAPADDFKFMCLLPPPDADLSIAVSIEQSGPNVPTPLKTQSRPSSDDEFEEVPLTPSESARKAASARVIPPPK